MPSRKKNPHAVALGKLDAAKGGRARALKLSQEQLSAVGRLAGRAGGKARAAKLISAQRREIARKAAATRWTKAKAA